MKRVFSPVLLLGILFAGVVSGTSGVSAAPPEHNTHHETITLICDGAVHVVVSIAHSQTTAFHSVSGGDVLILVSFDVIDPSMGEIVTIPIGQGKKVGQHGELITCETPGIDAVTATFLRVPR